MLEFEPTLENLVLGHGLVLRVPGLFETLQIKAPGNAEKIGAYLFEGLLRLQREHPLIGEVRGKGLFLGIELVSDRETREPVAEGVAMRVTALCMAKGLIISRTNRSFVDFNNTLCLSPALTIGREQTDQILSILEQALAEVGRGF